MTDKKNNKRENFLRISENRLNKILALLSQLTNLDNSSFYEYDIEDIEKMYEIIEDATKKSKEKLIKAKMKNKRIEL